MTALAGPLKRADVPAEPAWLVHVDCDGLRPTALGQYILGEMNKPEAQAKLAAFQALFNFDLRTQLHGLTLYGVGPAPEDGVLLVYADFDADRLTTLAKAAKDAQSNTYKQHVIYSWVDNNKKGKSGTQNRTYAAVHGSRVVFGQREERVAHALDVFSGAIPNLATVKTFPQLGTTGDTSFIGAAVRKFEFPATDPNAEILRLSKSVRLQVSEAQNQLNAILSLEAKDEEVGNHIASIANGLVSLMKLQKEKPESVKIAQGIALKQEGARVDVNLTLPAHDVIEILKADAARKAQKKQQAKQ